MFGAFSLVFISLFVHTQAQSCNVLAACPSINNIVPECRKNLTDDEVHNCVQKMLHDCHNQRDIVQNYKFVKRTNDAVCRDTSLTSELSKHNGVCWTKIRSCAVLQMISLDTDGNDDVCKEKERVKDDCLAKSSDECSDVEAKFVKTAYDGEKCNGASAIDFHLVHFAPSLCLLFLISLL